MIADGGLLGFPPPPRGGAPDPPVDFNPERIILDDAIDPAATFLPLADVRDRLTHRYGRSSTTRSATSSTSSLGARRWPTAASSPRYAQAPTRDELAIASMNVENLDGRRAAGELRPPGGQIVDNLNAPDILAVEEIQDNDGAATTARTQTRRHLRRARSPAIMAAGGPTLRVPADRPGRRTRTAASPAATSASASCSAPTRGLSFVDRAGRDADHADRRGRRRRRRRS